MKTFFACLCMLSCLFAHAQVSDNPATMAAFKAGISRVHDFPGVNGIGWHLEYGFPVSSWVQLETGVKRIQASGYPQTGGIREFTHATTIDFNVLFVPFSFPNSALKIGGGYSFVFYHLRRSDPVFTTTGATKTETWQARDSQGMANGCSLIGEYEYVFSDKVSAGARVSLAKAYSGHVWMGGPFVAVRL